MSAARVGTIPRGARVRYHRNGVGGLGFHTVQWTESDGRLMVASVFDEPGACAVVDRSNPALCWRGDVYEESARAAIDAAGDDAYRAEPEEARAVAALAAWVRTQPDAVTA